MALSIASPLQALFEPQTVAVIGASRNRDAVGFAILNNLVSGGFRGKVIPVNPKADHILDLACYPSILDVPEAVDLAVVVVPSAVVSDTLRHCGQKKIPAAVVISAGFREIGTEGANLEKEAARTAEAFGIRLLGPNCLGIINTSESVSANASFSRTMPMRGNIAFISQSGALCTAILDYAKGENIGFSKFVSLGNKADITELDILRYLKDDPETDVILMYSEDLADGRAFIEIAREITGDLEHCKPILMIKAGRTAEGARAAQSHTGSLMGTDEVYNAIFAQAGVMRVDTVEEMFDLARAFANEPLPRGNRAAIITNAGGPGIMATDACIRNGLKLAAFEPSTQAALREALPSTASVINPVDVIGDARHDRYEKALHIVANDPNVDCALVILTPQAMTDIEEIAHVVTRFDAESSFPVLASFMGIVDVQPGVRILEEHHVPDYRFPEGAARTLGAMVRYRQWIERPRTKVRSFRVDTHAVKEVLDEAARLKRQVLPMHQAMQVLRAYGFPVPPYHVARNADEAGRGAELLGCPVALKVISPAVIHKVDVGGVCLNLTSAEAAASAYHRMMKDLKGRGLDGHVEGVLIQPMAGKGREVILGMNRDPRFGPVILFGLGGIFVEALKDVTFRLAPIRQLGAQRMVESIRAYSILQGMRGEKPADVETITECLERLSQLVCAETTIREIDINPLLVFPEKMGAWVLDARILLGEA